MMKLYSRIDTKDTYFEMWGASTKHPDIRETLNTDLCNHLFCKSNLIEDEAYNFFQWVVQCLSGLDWGTWNYLTNFIKMCEPYFNKYNNYFH